MHADDPLRRRDAFLDLRYRDARRIRRQHAVLAHESVDLAEDLFGVENSFKALRGMQLALLDPRLMDSKKEAEKSLRAKIAAKPELEKQYGAAFGEIEKALVTFKDIRRTYQHFEGGGAFRGRLAWIAKMLATSRS